MIKREKVNTYLDNFIELNILLILFCLPFSKSIVEICVAVSIVSFFIKKVLIENSIKINIDKHVLIWLGLFIFFNALSNVNSQYIFLSVRALFTKVLKWTLFFIIVAETIRTKERLKRVFMVMLFSAGLILADAIYQQYITGIDLLHYPNRYPVFKFHDRPRGGTTFPTASFPFPGDFAAWINSYLFTFLILGYFYLRKRIKIYRVVVPLLSASLAFFLFLTTSAGGILGALFSTTLILINNIKKLLFPIISFFIVVILILSIIPYFRTYLKEGILDETLSINDRLNMWSIGWKIFKNHPVIGNGVNTFFVHFKNLRRDEDKHVRGSYAHNCFLQMAADIGLLGLVSFLGFAFLILYSNIKKKIQAPPTFKDAFITGLALGIIAFLVHSFFDTNLYSLNLSALFWLSLGIVEGMGSNGEDQ